jgi:quercetin dioxygenase-like cupin family protein
MNQMMTKPALRNVVSQPGTGRLQRVMGVTHTYRLEEQQTGGTLACIEVDVPPGAGVPPHTHYWEDELFYVLQGSVEITGDDLPRPTVLSQGGLFYSPKRRTHGFRNNTDQPLRLLVLMTPGGNMQRMFGALSALSARAKGNPKPEDVAALCAPFDIMFAPAAA